MGSSQRDAGLVRAVGTWGLAASIFSMVVGASIFVVPAALAQYLGAYAPLAILLCALSVGSVAICFAEGGSRLPSSGGAYGYIEAAFGPLVGYVAGTLLWFSDVLACGGIAAALADIGAGFVAAGLRAGVHALIIVTAIAIIALVNVRGVAQGMRLVNATALLKTAPLAMFLVAGIGATHWSNFAAHAPPNGPGLGRALILALFAFTGMETSLCTSGEVIDPGRTIPRALALAMLSVSVLYVAIQIIAQGILGTALPASAEPLADAMGRISPTLRVAMLAGTALAMFGYLSGDLLSTPRILFAFARDGLLPRVLGRVHPHSSVPHVAILGYAALAVVLALSGSFAELAILSALATAPFYIAGCAASWRLARRGVAQAGPPLAIRGLAPAAGLGITSMLILIGSAARTEQLGLAALIGISTAVFLAQNRWARRAPAEPAGPA